MAISRKFCSKIYATMGNFIMEYFRTVILHYHLFKNAGTSIDRILKDNFEQAWVTREFPSSGGDNSAQVRDWIVREHDAIAFSSHTMIGPIPRIEGVRIVTVMALRDPISRIRSAYAFERKQSADTFGSVLARHTNLDGYVRVRLALPHDRQCRNFQVSRLSSMRPGEEPEIERALAAVADINVLGTVERFDDMLNLLQVTVGQWKEGFEIGNSVHANRSDSINQPLDADLEALLRSTNADDLELVAKVQSPSPESGETRPGD